MLAARKPPVRDGGVISWLRENLFSSVGNTLTTFVVGAVLLYLGVGLLRWIFIEATWGPLWRNLRLLAVYRYPAPLVWRPLSVVAIFIALLGLSAGIARGRGGTIIAGVYWQFAAVVFLITIIALATNWPMRWAWFGVSVAALAGYGLGALVPRLERILLWLWLASLPATIVLIYGLPFAHPTSAMRVVPVREWGGILLTFVLTTGIIPAFPLGIALALGRRSKLPAIKAFCIGVIELVRGAPLITWLFIASLLVPLVFNVEATRIPALLRAYVAIALFATAYMAENVRGGLQSVPRGQYEAAQALGLSSWQMTRLIILPQALRAVIPAIVGQSIGLFKDTSLVFILGLLDLFNVHNVVAQQPESIMVTGGVRLELSLFLCLFYFCFAYRLSVASRQLERHLGVGTR